MRIKYELMKEAGGILRDAFSLIFYKIKPGANLENIDAEVGQYLADNKAISGLRLVGFPYNMCASLDFEVTQGYPNRVLQEDQIVSIDMSILYKGVYVDKARTVSMPSADPTKVDLADRVHRVLPMIQPHIRPGIVTGYVGKLISDTLLGTKYCTCRYLGGHGIGDNMHENPKIPNYDDGSKDVLLEGQFVTIEPIIYGHPLRCLSFDHKWTITSDEVSAHAEDTICIKKDSIEVLT